MQRNETGTNIDTTNAHSVVLNGALEIADINALYRSLEQALCSTASTLTLNAEGIERIDAASLQLLTIFCREAREQGYAIQWKKPSDVLQRSAQLVGLADRLGL